MAARVSLAISAVLLVVGVALASLLPLDEPLSQVLAGYDPTLLMRLQHFELRHFDAFLWQELTVPVLLRPAWILPFGLGVVAGGCALSLSWREGEPSVRRRPGR